MVQPSVLDASKQMTIDVLINEPRVVSASLDLCKWFVQDSAVYEITKDYMQQVCLRDDVYDTMTWQLACAAFDGLQGLSPEDTPVRNMMQQLGFDLLASPEIGEHAIHNYLYMPVFNTLTLGIYGLVAPPNASPADVTKDEDGA